LSSLAHCVNSYSPSDHFYRLAAQLEKQDASCQTMIMPHDGYHYPLDSLRLFQNAEDAIYRRGAPDTFDPHALRRDLLRIRDGPEDFITVPAFDHAKGDPEPDRHAFDRHQHSVVICEGLYLLHNRDGWEDIASLFDLSIFVNSDVDICVERLKVRNQCIPGYTPEEISIRCERVDRVNSEIVMEGRDRADIVVQSLATKPPERMASPIPSVLEFPAEPTMERTLTMMTLTDADLAAVEVDTDWTMDITSRMGGRPRGDSLWSEHPPETAAEAATRHRRASSMATGVSGGESVPPEPAAQHIGDWVEATAQAILKGARELATPSAPEPINTTEVSIRSAAQARPYMCALVGMPGSGKTVSAFLLANRLEEEGFPTMILPHDGYHYTLDYLRTFPHAEDLVYRRGAPDTFDPHALHRDLARIRDGTEELIRLPAFDHSRADPEPDTHAFDRHRHKIVLCEGLWLLHDGDGWEDTRSYFDFTMYLDSDIDVCIERVKIRNQCIPGYTLEDLQIRCERVDRVNAETVAKSKSRADLVLQTQ